MPGFIRRFTSTPTLQQLTAIEGVVIIDLPPAGQVSGITEGFACVAGEFANMQYAVSIDQFGVVTSRPQVVQFFSGTDMLNKLGGFDPTLGDFGGSDGNGILALQNKRFTEIAAIPLFLASTAACRVFRELPTNTSATRAQPAVPVTGGSAVASTQFQDSSSHRVNLAQNVNFTNLPPNASGLDGTTEATATPATAASETGGAGPFNVSPGATFKVKIGGSETDYTFGGTQGNALGTVDISSGVTVASGNLVFTVNGVSCTASIPTNPTQVQVLDALNAAIVAAGALGFATDDGSGHAKIISGRYGTGSTVALTAGTQKTAIFGASPTITAGTATIDPGSGAVSVTIANMAAATASELATALTIATITGATMTVSGGSLLFQTTATGTSATLQVLSTSTNSLGFDNNVHTGTNAGPGSSATNTFITPGGVAGLNVQKGDALVVGVADLAGVQGEAAGTYRVVSVAADNETITCEKQDGTNFSFPTAGSPITNTSAPWALTALTLTIGGQSVTFQNASAETAAQLAADINVAGMAVTNNAAPWNLNTVTMTIAGQAVTFTSPNAENLSQLAADINTAAAAASRSDIKAVVQNGVVVIYSKTSTSFAIAGANLSVLGLTAGSYAGRPDIEAQVLTSGAVIISSTSQTAFALAGTALSTLGLTAGTYGSGLVWRIEPASNADSGGQTRLSDLAGYTVPVRTLDATIASNTNCLPTVPQPSQLDGAPWTPLAGLELHTHPTTAISFNANTQAPNVAANAEMDVLYANALNALMQNTSPAKDVSICWAARTDGNIRSSLLQTAVNRSAVGVGLMACVSPDLSVVTLEEAISTGSPGVGATRAERVIYSWPNVQTLVPAAVGTPIKGADGQTYTNGQLDTRADGWMACILSNLASELNPGQGGDLTASILAPMISYSRSTDPNNELTLQGWEQLKASGVAGPIYDSGEGSWTFQSGITSSLIPGETNINRQRMQDEIGDSLAAAMKPYVKQVVKQTLIDAEHGVIDGYLQGLLSPNNPAAQRIAAYSIDDKSGNTQALNAQGVYIWIILVQMLATQDTIGLQLSVGPTVQVTNLGNAIASSNNQPSA